MDMEPLKLRRLRESMVERQLKSRGLADKRVLSAMGSVPREAFVPAAMRDQAYADGPLPIGNDQTISQPYIVASMTEALELSPGDKVLEIGTGSGYQAAILAEAGYRVFTVERISALQESARRLLLDLGYTSVEFHLGDGFDGWREHAPYDGILVTAAAPFLPGELVDQLAAGGRMVIPVGTHSQELRVYLKNGDGSLSERSMFPVRFVPMLPGQT